MNTKQNIPEHWLKIIDRVKFYQENPLGFNYTSIDVLENLDKYRERLEKNTLNYHDTGIYDDLQYYIVYCGMSCGIYLSLIDQIRNNARSLEVFRKNWGEGFERFENEVLICQEALERCDFPKILAKTKTLIKLFLKKDNLSTEYIKMKLETILDKGDIVCPK